MDDGRDSSSDGSAHRWLHPLRLCAYATVRRGVVLLCMCARACVHGWSHHTMHACLRACACERRALVLQVCMDVRSKLWMNGNQICPLFRGPGAHPPDLPNGTPSPPLPFPIVPLTVRSAAVLTRTRVDLAPDPPKRARTHARTRAQTLEGRWRVRSLCAAANHCCLGLWAYLRSASKDSIRFAAARRWRGDGASMAR